MADNVSITPGVGKTVATDEVVDGTLGTVQVQFVKLMDGTLDSTNKAIVNSSGGVKVDGSSVTQPVSIASMPSTPVTGPLTDTQLRATAVPVSGTFFQATQPISGSVSQAGTWTVQPGNTANTTAWKVDGSAVTQPVSAASLPLPTGASTSANQSTTNTSLSSIDSKTPALVNGLQPVLSNQQPALLGVTAVGAAAAAVTLTIPAVASQFHYITLIEIQAYTTVARTGVATPITVTSTNLAGANAWTFATAAALGTTDAKLYVAALPIKSSVVNTATTIVCPATASVIWRVNVFYYAAV